MKLAKWIYLGVPLLIGIGMLMASQPKDKQVSPRRGIDFDYDSSWTGNPLSSAESTTVAAAIESIATGPPDSITYSDADGNDTTVSCSTLAANLKAQLDSGLIEREDQNDADGGEYGGGINVSPGRIAACSTDAGKTFLEELLIHEETHKGAHQDGQTNDENEAESYGAEKAYKDSVGLDSATNGDYRDTLARLKAHLANHAAAEARRAREVLADAVGKRCFIDHGEGLDPDFFKSHALTGGDYVYDLSPFLKASDMLMHVQYPPFGPDHSLALICGGDPILGHGRILGLDIFDGQVQPPETLMSFDMYPPMFFYSMAYSPETERYYMVDTLNQQVVILPDWDEDLIPEMDVSVFADALMFPELMGMRSVEPTWHRYHGFGLIVNHEDARYTDAIYPYDQRFFLPDADGNDTADACIPVSRYEFAQCKPHIAPPWENEVSVRLFASWDHPIEVHATDSLGQPPYEWLGTVWMEMPHMVCGLGRPLVAGEFIIAVDAENGRKLNLASKVIDPTPEALTAQLDAAGVLTLRWEAVPGADYYNVYESPDPMDFTGAMVYFTDTNEFSLPMPPDAKLFYQVTAAKEGGPMR